MAGSEVRSTNTVERNGTGPGADQVQANPRGPVSSHVDRGTATEAGGRPLPVGIGDTGPGQAGNNDPSLAKEVLTWLRAGNSSAMAPGGTGPNPGSETEGPAATSVGITIEERELTVEDFWSLLRDVGYETW